MAIEELQVLCLVRVPPGDRWKAVNAPSKQIFESLTEGLEYIFSQTKCTEYRFSAGQGKVFMIEQREVEPEIIPPKTFNIYGETS